MRGQCKLGQKRLPAPFYNAKNYEIEFLGKKRLLIKKGQGKPCPRPVQIELLIRKHFNSFLHIYQQQLKMIKGSHFVFESVDLLDYKLLLT